MGTYKYLLIYIALFEIIYSIVDMIISPILFSHDSIYMVIVNVKTNMLSGEVLLILDAVYCGCYGSFMGLFALNFIYRYFVASGSKYLATFNNSKFFLWLSIPLIYGIIWGMICYFLISPTSQIDNVMRNEVMLNFGWEMEDITYIGPYCYQKQQNETYIIDLNSIIALILMSTIIISSISALIFFGVRCYLKINQLFKGVILMHTPCSCIFIFTLLDLDLGTLSGISTLTVALFPALDPLPTMFLIENYRNVIINCFSEPVKKLRTSSELKMIAT
ncbi:unnamed protein product [Caenorhabditis angaria]|uniref:Seven TM Receptor n=1 Tax=Caenorhabditis angaria TaxID=860376 RepID=A0A9P1IX07_9PELO|nr:unnamed protein product [Caenorhabditis angaria]